MSRHLNPAPPARDARLITALGLTAGALTAASLAMLWIGTWPDTTPTSVAAPAVVPSEPSDDGGVRGQRFPRAVLPTIVPPDAPVWDESKGRVIVDGLPLTPAEPAPVDATPAPTAADPPAPPAVESTQHGEVAAGQVAGTPPIVAGPAESDEPTGGPEQPDDDEERRERRDHPRDERTRTRDAIDDLIDEALDQQGTTTP